MEEVSPTIHFLIGIASSMNVYVFRKDLDRISLETNAINHFSVTENLICFGTQSCGIANYYVRGEISR